MARTAPPEMVAAYLQARIERDKAQAHLDEVQSRLIKEMEAEQRKSYRWVTNGRAHNLTFVQQYTNEIDERGLRKALTAKVFDRYTKRVLDRKAMEAAMDTGEVDKMIVSRYVDQRPKRPFLSYTSRKEVE